MIQKEDRILMIVPTDEMGGAEQLVKQLAINYQLNGKNVCVICLTQKTSKNGWSDYLGEIIYFNTSIVYLGFLFLLFYLYNKKFALVFSSQVYINGFLGLLRKFRWYTPTKLIVRESTSVFLRFTGFRLATYKLLYKIGYRNTDLIICQTELMKSQLLSNFKNLNFNKVLVINNPINLDDIKSKSLLNFENGEMSTNTLVALGRMIPAKGFDLLIQSFYNISIKKPELKLLILGDGPERKNLNDLIIKFKLQDKVEMPGYSKNPFPYLKHAKLCVVSSLIEGFPNILLQMMALNTKIVCTKCAGGIDEIKGITTVETNSVTSLSKSILEALEKESNSETRRIFDEYLDNKSLNNFIISMEKGSC